MRVQTRYEPAFVRWTLIALALALVCLIASVAGACPTCKEGLAPTDPHGEAIAAGIAFAAGPTLTVTLDAMRINYGDVPAVNNPSSNAAPGRPSSRV